MHFESRLITAKQQAKDCNEVATAIKGISAVLSFET